MTKGRKVANTGAMLDLWRPPQGAGDPVGCLATTYTFAPGLFDEQCLARFLEIESEPSREDLAFLLERESRLGGVYAGVLVDHRHAGVEHSLRWDVLPVRIHTARQHAKVSLLVWSRHVRIIVASANLTEQGYRYNYEVAATVELTPDEANLDILANATHFLRRLVLLVSGASARPPEVQRAEKFLDQVERQVRKWNPVRRRETVRQQLVFTIPAGGTNDAARSSLEEAIQVCRGRGGSPQEAWIASPFFDGESDAGRVTASLCKLMARGEQRELCFCVPAIRDEAAGVPRLAAPKSLLLTPARYNADVFVEMLPERDADKNLRPWHAKMLALMSEQYAATMVGSSNFTCAGMGVGQRTNAEANLVIVVDREAYGREVGQLEAVWPEMEQVANPESAEWLGARLDGEEEDDVAAPPLPEGFLSATYHAGDTRLIVLGFDPDKLPPEWAVHAVGRDGQELLTASRWRQGGREALVELAWSPVQPPEKLLVQWAGHEAFLPLNVDDGSKLPPPAQLESMSADDMLWILAATDPSAAYRAWTKAQQPSSAFDTDLDSATPIDLDPLRRYDLQATFLHRVRRRARVLAQMRANLQRPVAGRQSLEWRLKGLIGIEPLADRPVREFTSAAGPADEALLTIADFLIVLREVDYQPTDGSLPKEEFDEVFRSFLKELTDKLRRQLEAHRDRVSEDLMHFWQRVVQRGRA